MRLAGAWELFTVSGYQSGTVALTSIAMVGFQAPVHWSNKYIITFPRPYATPPIVTLVGGKNDTIIWPIVANVTTTALEYRMATVTNAVIPATDVFWTARRR